MDEVTTITTNGGIYYMIKDILLLIIIFYSVFLNSLMINKNINKFKVTFISLSVALVSVWQIYYFNQYTYLLSNTIWLCALLIVYASNMRRYNNVKLFVCLFVFVFIPTMFSLVYLEIFGNAGLQIANFIVHLTTATMSFYIFMLARDVYLKISSLMLIISAVTLLEILLRIIPHIIDNIDVMKIWSTFNWVSCIIFMYGIHRQVVRHC